MSAIMVLQHCT